MICKIDHLNFRGIELVKLFLTIQVKDSNKHRISKRLNSNLLLTQDQSDVMDPSSLSRIGEYMD